MNKICLVGAGRVGEAAAQVLAKEEICQELVLVGVHEGAAQGAALDLMESAPLFAFDTQVRGGISLDAVAGADIVVISAGMARRPGMSRSDVLDANAPIVARAAQSVGALAPHALIVVVTNPVDVLTHLAWSQSGLPRARVIGLSGTLDAARMAGFIAAESGLSVRDVRALVIGGHGDTMIPLPRYSTISGIPVGEFLNEAAMARVVERTRGGGAEILALKKTGSAYDAPGAAIATMVDAVARNRRRILPCVCVLDGEYRESGVAIGVPAVIGAGGVERIIELTLTPAEQQQFHRSADAIRTDLARVDITPGPP
ncbi:malate dehydrogenase [Acidiferrobacter sp.]|uniref:malate dehydrogenase n=1 Tax=Acidiferrobacter sp. TaxID=1872107 RepID=UPI0026117602|nr:malate dehydrogenase [Acidiferrobacter sp.]